MKRCHLRHVATMMALLPMLLLGTALAGEPPQSSASRGRGTRAASEPQVKIVVGGGATLEFVETPLDKVIDILHTHNPGVAPPAASVDFVVRGAPGTLEERIVAALGESTQLEFIETPLQDVLDFLKDLHSIEIQIDHRALEDVGIGSDTPITMNVKGVSLRSALRLMLRQLDLTYVICDEVLLIVPIDALEATSTRVYSVAELLNFGETADELAETLAVALARQEKSGVSDSPKSTEKKAGRPSMRIVPYRQVIIVVASTAEHETLGRLLYELSLGLEGKTSSPAVRDKPPESRTEPAHRRARRQRSKQRHKSREPEPVGGNPPQKQDPCAGGADDEDPFAGSSDDDDPFGGGEGDEDPFGGGGDDEDPFG